MLQGLFIVWETTETHGAESSSSLSASVRAIFLRFSHVLWPSRSEGADSFQRTVERKLMFLWPTLARHSKRYHERTRAYR